jgi:hypothetical protein
MEVSMRLAFGKRLAFALATLCSVVSAPLTTDAARAAALTVAGDHVIN